MKNLFSAGILAVLIAVPSAGRAEDIARFAPLKTEELTPPQKAWADAIAIPPRNAKFGNPPYRAYIRSPDLAPRLSALSDYLSLEYLVVAAAERTCDPDHCTAMDRAI